MPKQGQMIRSSTGQHEFLMDGFGVNVVKPVTVDADYLTKNPGAPEIILLDFLTWPKMSDDILNGKTLRLRSSHD